MTSKCARLKVAPTFVNAALGAILLLAAGACSRAEKAPKTAPSATAGTTLDAGAQLPAIWSTGPLDGAVQSLALSSGEAGLLAVAYDGGGLQFYNLEAEPVGEKALFKLKDLAGGGTALIGERLIAVFPGLTPAGELKAYVFGEGLVGPTQVDLKTGESDRIAGVCSGPAGTEGVMRLAFWTELNNKRLRAGMVKVNGGELNWEAGEPTEAGFPITSCAYTADTLVASPSALDAVGLNGIDMDTLLFIDPSQRVTISTNLGMTQQALSFRNGITISAPVEAQAIAALGSAKASAMPSGMIVVAGETGTGNTEAVFIDPSPLQTGTK